jgi:hypothetical protein
MNEVLDQKKNKSEGRMLAEQWFLGLMERMEKGETGSEVKIDITPEMAEVLLENNKSNRRLRETLISRTADDIRAGRWQWNGETIIISSSADLNDGQHRLHSIVRAGIPITTSLVWGVPRDSRESVDTGAARQPADSLRMRELVNANTLAAVTRMIIGYETYGSLGQNSRITSGAVVERAAADHDIQLIATWCTNLPRLFSRMVSASIAGAAFYIIQQKAPRHAKTFMNRLKDGDQLSKDSPIWKLRERLSVEVKLSPQMKLELILKTWNMWIADSSFKRIHIMGKLPSVNEPDFKAPKPEPEIAEQTEGQTE